MQLICEYFSKIERQGSGSSVITLKALSFIESLYRESRIVDLGCGTGDQAILLAKHTPGFISGIDVFHDFIKIFNANSGKHDLQDRVKDIVASMDNLHFQEGELDMIWSEGVICNIRFKRGLDEWRRYIKTGSYIAVSKASWFTEKRPDEINTFCEVEYPEIDTIPKKVMQMQKAGYIPGATLYTA